MTRKKRPCSYVRGIKAFCETVAALALAYIAFVLVAYAGEMIGRGIEFLID